MEALATVLNLSEEEREEMLDLAGGNVIRYLLIYLSTLWMKLSPMHVLHFAGPKVRDLEMISGKKLTKSSTRETEANMDYNGRKLVPYIPPAEYDKVAYEFLEQFYPDALKNPMPVPIIITSPFFLSYPMTR